MSRRRRAALLLGLALAMGGLAASDVSRREAALERRLGPTVPVLVARGELVPGTELSGAQVAVRHVPARYAPAGGLSSLAEVAGLRLAVAVAGGSYITAGQVQGAGEGAPGAGLRRGERVAEVVAVAPVDALTPGSRVDVVVSRDDERGDGGRTVLALEDVEVLAAAPAGPGGPGGGGTTGPNADAPRAATSLRVTVRQAVFLAAAQSFAREVRLLARAPGDRRRGLTGLAVDGSLGL